MDRTTYDVAIIGGGIVGMATARALGRSSRPAVVVLEAADHLAAQQTGHNTGVVHSGIFYPPGTLKARLCVEGRDALYAYCPAHGVAIDRCGKVMIASDERDLPGLAQLQEWGRANGLRGVRRLAADEIKEFEPHAVGLAGLHVPEAGIVDFAEVARALAREVSEAGGRIVTGARVRAVRREGRAFVLETEREAFRCGLVVNCAGVEADRVARLCGVDPGVLVVPFRGQFYRLDPACQFLVRNLIYPVPDLRLPFLGVHITRTIHGSVEADPNGALHFCREGYGLGCVSMRDLGEMLARPGFWLMVAKHLRTGLVESVRAVSKRAFVRPLQRLVPELRPEHFQATRSGIHAQAVEPSGALVNDFRIVEQAGSVHVLNTTSPAATASLRLGEEVAARVEKACAVAREL